jgi:fructose-bisphosphate aldolase, class II
LNAHDIFPDWIALNNGTTHGIEASAQGIQVELTAEIHKALAGYAVSGAQHGTSGNNSDRLRAIAAQTYTTKANVATALQMVSWGLRSMSTATQPWMPTAISSRLPAKALPRNSGRQCGPLPTTGAGKKGDYKNLNLPFENKIMGQPKRVRERMARRVENFVYTMLVEVFNAADTARFGVDAILEAGSYDLGPKTGRIESPENWTEARIREQAAPEHRQRAAGQLRRLSTNPKAIDS